MFALPTENHHWLKKLLGDWNFTHNCDVKSDGSENSTGQPSVISGKMTTRMIGELWIELECSGDHPDKQGWTSKFQLGFDSTKNQFVGSFIASMMSNLWIYEGTLNPEGNVLTLNTSGPACDASGQSDGSTANYQDIVELINDDLWTLTSQIQLPDGSWAEFMRSEHRRA